MDLVEMIKELFTLYDEFGSEMTPTEQNFMKLLVTKAQTKGLSTDHLSQQEVLHIKFLHNKYSHIEAFDSDEGDGMGRGG